jgi:hypothetical protein
MKMGLERVSRALGRAVLCYSLGAFLGQLTGWVLGYCFFIVLRLPIRLDTCSSERTGGGGHKLSCKHYSSDQLSLIA